MKTYANLHRIRAKTFATICFILAISQFLEISLKDHVGSCIEIWNLMSLSC